MAFDEAADLIGSCEASLDTVGLLIGDIKEEIQDRSDSWTIAEILNHMLETELRYGSRIRRLRRERHPQMRVLPDGDYKKLTALKAWSEFYEARRANLTLLRQLRANEWKRSGTLAPIGRVTIESLVRHLVAHDATHTGQIARRLSGRSE